MHPARLSSPLSFSVVLGALLLAACGGGVDDGGRAPAPSAGEEKKSPPDPSSTVTTPPGTSKPPTTTTGCPDPEAVIVASGGALKRPAGSALRLDLVYQGTEIGIRNATGMDRVLAPSDGPFKPGAGSGYWVETASAAGTLYQRLMRDPTILEAPAGPGGSDFTNSTIPQCQAKTLLADVPNDAAATEVRIYGSPYGTQDAAVLLGRFTLE